jgi:hypothetical protein
MVLLPSRNTPLSFSMRRHNPSRHCDCLPPLHTSPRLQCAAKFRSPLVVDYQRNSSETGCQVPNLRDGFIVANRAPASLLMGVSFGGPSRRGGPRLDLGAHLRDGFIVDKLGSPPAGGVVRWGHRAKARSACTFGKNTLELGIKGRPPLSVLPTRSKQSPSPPTRRLSHCL